MNRKRTSSKLDPSHRGAIPRGEWLLVGLIVLVGFGFRVAFPSRIAVEHFDEAVYASNQFFPEEVGGRYPARHLYAPPLLPKLIEWTTLFLGTSGPGPMAVNILAGSLTVALCWWVGRRWFGATAGLVAASLAALSDIHIIYSRTALTDPLLCFWMLLSVYLIWEAYCRMKPVWVIAAGLSTAAAWWTKYNGWLPMAVGLSGLIPWFITHKVKPRAAGRYVLVWFAIAGLAFAAWSPVLYGLSDYGGYAAVQANHRGYLVDGVGEWFQSLLLQSANHGRLESWPSYLSLVAVAVVIWKSPGQLPDAKRSKVFALVSAIWIAVVINWFVCIGGTSLMLGLLTCFGLCIQLRPNHQDECASVESDNRQLAAWLLAAWFVGLTVATPLYHPYPRLTLPWLVAAWLGMAGLFGGTMTLGGERSTLRALGGKGVLLGILSVLWILNAVYGVEPYVKLAPQQPVSGWRDRSGLQRIAKEIIADATHVTGGGGPDATDNFVVYVYAEPALFYHVRAQGAAAAPVSDLSFAEPGARRLPVKTFFAMSPQELLDPDFRKSWKGVAHRFRSIDGYVFEPSEFVQLNQYSPAQLGRYNFARKKGVRLFELK